MDNHPVEHEKNPAEQEIYLTRDVALGIRYDRAADDVLLPIEVVAQGAGIARQTLNNWRCNKTATGPKPVIRGRFVYYLKGDVKKWILTGKSE